MKEEIKVVLNLKREVSSNFQDYWEPQNSRSTNGQHVKWQNWKMSFVMHQQMKNEDRTIFGSLKSQLEWIF